jgi:glycosyltransferase involved in cell wall biosynthesis
LETYSRCYEEAWHFNLPILTSDRDFACERCENAALYFDPLDADSVAMSMARIMEDGDLRGCLVENGRRILAEAPTWDDGAARFVEVLERTARGEPPVVDKSEFRHEINTARVA